MSDDDDTIVSPERIAAARRAWIAEGRQAFGTELFSRAVYGPDGKHGDVVIGADDELEALVGSEVTAKRLGWDDGEAVGDDSDLTGVLSVRRVELPDGTRDVVWEVGGQPADPDTVCERTTEPPRTG